MRAPDHAAAGLAGVLDRHPPAHPLRAEARLVPGLGVRGGVHGAPPAPLPARAHPRARLHGRPDPQPPLRPDRRADDDVRRLRARQGPRPAARCCCTTCCGRRCCPSSRSIGVRLSYAIGGSVVVETVFALPGLGSWMVESILARDYMVVQTLTLAFALGAMLINLATDLDLPALRPARPGGLWHAVGTIAVDARGRDAGARASRVRHLAAGGCMLGLLVLVALIGPLRVALRPERARLRPAPPGAEPRAPLRDGQLRPRRPHAGRCTAPPSTSASACWRSSSRSWSGSLLGAAAGYHGRMGRRRDHADGRRDHGGPVPRARHRHRRVPGARARSTSSSRSARSGG